jgi:hypothetical protein
VAENTVWRQKICLVLAAYANRHVFARSEKELVCASLAAAPMK